MKQIEISNNQLIIHTNPVPIIVQAVLGILLVIVIGLMALIFYSMTNGSGLHLGYFIGLGILGFLGWRFIRLYLWNKNGKEIFYIEDNKLKYIADYGKFKDGAQELKLTKEIKAVINDHNNRPHKYIAFDDHRDSDEHHEGIASVIKLEYSEDIDYYKLEHDLNVWLMRG